MPMGSMTAPERMWAPTSEPFSSTQTLTSRPASAASCLSRMAAASPAGPAPTMTTSYSMLSRWMGSDIFGASLLVRLCCAVPDGVNWPYIERSEVGDEAENHSQPYGRGIAGDLRQRNWPRSARERTSAPEY